MRRFTRIPIFVEGDHKHGPWTAEDVFAMARNATVLKSIHKAPIVIGHEENQVQFFGDTGTPSFGHSQEMSVGYQLIDGKPKTALFADFEEVPDRIASLIHRGTYRRISPEVYTKLPSAFRGKVEGPVVKRIAILGGETPEIKDLKDITDIVREQMPEDSFASPRANVTLAFSDEVVDKKSGTAIAFCDAVVVNRPRRTFTPKAELSAKTLQSMAVCFADDGMPNDQGLALSREELIALLGDMGFDVTTIAPTVGDDFLIETVRLMRLLIEEAAAATAEVSNQNIETKAATDEQAAETEDDAMAETKEKETPVAFNDAQQKEIDAAVERAVAKFRDDQQIQLKPLREKIQRDRAAADIAFCDSLVQQGKLLPSEVDAGLPELLSQLDAATVVKFGDGKELTLADKFKAILSARPNLVKFSDSIKHKVSTDLDSEKEAIVSFCDENEKALKSAGQTKDMYLANFEKARKVNAELTAKEFLHGPQSA